MVIHMETFLLTLIVRIYGSPDGSVLEVYDGDYLKIWGMYGEEDMWGRISTHSVML